MTPYYVKVRFGNEVHDVRAFVTPEHLDVQRLAELLHHDAAECYAWVCRNVIYPTNFSDRHQISAFTRSFVLGGPFFNISADEFWQFPAETLGWRRQGRKTMEDCDGTAILLCSLLRTFKPASDVYVGVGGMSEIDHAWVRLKHGGQWYVLESTLDEPAPLYSIPERHPYNLACYFNDVDSVELVPGAFASLSGGRHPGRNAEKIKIIERYLNRRA